MPKLNEDNQGNGDLVVGIGASAGGLSAFTSFFGAMPPDSGMSFVLVQHLSPDYKSQLSEILGKSTDMPVMEAEDGMELAPNTVFVIPPDSTLTISDRKLMVRKPAPPRPERRPIDTFFFSLAQDVGESAVCIILAGTGTDGTLGLGAIKENGGLTIAQAEYDHMAMSGMPQSAVASGQVDVVLAVGDIPAKLMSYQSHLQKVASVKGEDGIRQDMASHLSTISKLLHAKLGHDFGRYKENTLTRRVQRRMQVLQVDTLPEYIEILKTTPVQIELLFREFLIGVTQFFRDPLAFEALEKTALPKLLEHKTDNDTVRVWVPGCSTGEEVYSIAILLKEACLRMSIAPKLQLFGTDVDDRAVATARAARYRNVTGISAERLERWFAADGDHHCPIKEIREICIFSPHSVVKDPPFSKLDLLSCRNLLIYMNADLQDRVLHSFHYALRRDGILFLGPSEGTTRLTSAFVALDKKHRIFTRLDSELLLPQLSPAAAGSKAHPYEAAKSASGEDRTDRNARRALEQYAPVFVVIDRDQNIVRFSGGNVGAYLEPSSGAASLKLFTLLRKNLQAAVRDALQVVADTKLPFVQDDIALTIDGKNRLITLIVTPIPADLCVVAFQDSRFAGADLDPLRARVATTEHDCLAVEQELRTTKIQLQTAIDDLLTTSEDMKSATEEYQSVNEELQSSNEELETAKEEMQSVNEELHTINAEMTAKNEMMMLLNSDLKNLLDSTDIATVFLDNNLRIKTFTTGMTQIIHLRDEDRGRPITEIVTLLNYTELQSDVRHVLRTLKVMEKEVHLVAQDMTFIMRIHPYRTIDNYIDGVVITFVDISARKKAEERAALLMGELDHRVKNILSIVSVVVKQTLTSSTSAKEFADNIEGRIAAISRAHSVLTKDGGQTDTIFQTLIETELAPYVRDGNITVSGPDVMLSPKASLALAMAIHELCSNAAKFGSLSIAPGRLSVTWSVIGTNGDQTLHLIWAETDGPPVKPPKRRGFGTTLIERGLPHEFDATVKREFLQTGVRCAIDIPLTDAVGRLRPKPDH